MKRRVLMILAGLAAVVILALIVPGTRWRVRLLTAKATGRVPDVSWPDLARMMRPGSGVYLEPMVENGYNPYAAISDPLTSPADVTAGGEAFKTQCSSCHGTGPHGGSAPDLSRGEFKHGGSDWALFRTIRSGVPQTPMPPHPLPARDLWRLVAYIRSIDKHRSTAAASAAPAAPAPELTPARLVDAAREPGNWLTYHGSFDGRRHSSLNQVNRATVGRLRARWVYQLPTADARVEATPIVVDSTMYVSYPPADVVALNTRTGAVLWTFHHDVPDQLALCCGRVNRGVAVLGNTVYLGTMDAHLIAIDARTGRQEWDVPVAQPQDGYSITGAPLAFDSLIVTGVGGGEYGIRGFLDAYDARTGARVWRFYTIPAPGEAGSDTWLDGSWKTGGAPTWMTGTYDPASGTLYWGVGNPSPPYNGSGRTGANLYSNSLLALDAHTGRLRWSFQYMAHEQFDFDAIEIPMLLDLGSRPVVATAQRNGFYYTFDRATGRFLGGRNFAQVTWAKGLDSLGGAILNPGAVPSPQGTEIYPGDGGATNWWSPTYSPGTGLFYVAVTEKPGLYYSAPAPYQKGAPYVGGDVADLPGRASLSVLRALVPATGALAWERILPVPTGSLGGLLSTDGDLVFGGDEDVFYAVDARSGSILWSFKAGAHIAASPVTYLASRRQQISIVAGRDLMTFTLDGN